MEYSSQLRTGKYLFLVDTAPRYSRLASAQSELPSFRFLVIGCQQRRSARFRYYVEILSAATPMRLAITASVHDPVDPAGDDDGSADADLLASPLTIKSASIFRAREAGTRAFKMRFSRPGTILERFLSRPLRPSDTHCSTLIGFIGMVFGSRPNFSSTAVFVNPAASTVT